MSICRRVQISLFVVLPPHANGIICDMIIIIKHINRKRKIRRHSSASQQFLWANGCIHIRLDTFCPNFRSFMTTAYAKSRSNNFVLLPSPLDRHMAAGINNNIICVHETYNMYIIFYYNLGRVIGTPTVLLKHVQRQLANSTPSDHHHTVCPCVGVRGVRYRVVSTCSTRKSRGDERIIHRCS